MVAARSGLAVTDHDVPSQDSTRVDGGPSGAPVEPTARQRRGVGQETERSVSPPVPGLGVGSADQAEPSHRSASVRPVPAAETRSPTAMQNAAPLQETPERLSLRSPAGAGPGATDQLVPSHDSIRARWLAATAV